MAVQDDNTILKKADLKAYHQQIAGQLGGTFALRTNNGDYFSTDERVVGVWTDGKPLYQKTISLGVLPNTDTKSVAHGVTDMDQVIDIKSTAWGISGGKYYAFLLPNVPFEGVGTYTMSININGSDIDVWTGSDRRWLTGQATIQYTKTTDQPNSAITSGAYDIAFPNTWPANTEIFLGNGVYGYRATGNMPAIEVGKAKTRVFELTVGLNAKTINIGGGIYGKNAADQVFFLPLNITRTALSSSATPERMNMAWTSAFILDGVFLVNVGSEANDYFSTTDTYDFWVTYTKGGN